MSETPESKRLAETPAESTGIAWGDDISPERLAELKRLFVQQLELVELPSFNVEQSAFSNEVLTGADVFWIVAMAWSGSNPDLSRAAAALRDSELGPWGDLMLPDPLVVHLEGAFLWGAQLQGAILNYAQLKDANLTRANLQRASLGGAQLQESDLGQAELQGASLYSANLQRASLNKTNLEGASLREAQLQGANLNGAKLEGANLHKAHLEGADLREAHLERADLGDAQMEKAKLSNAYLERADLRGASFNKASWLNDAVLEGVCLDQVTFDNTNLSVVP